MKDPILKEIYKNWSNIGDQKTKEELQLDLKLYKHLLEIVQVGDSYYFVFDPSRREMDLVSPLIEDVLHIPVEQFDISYMLENIHPEDLPVFSDFESAVVEFKLALPKEKLLRYKSRYNYRLRTGTGKYIHILQQSITIEMDNEGRVLRNLVIHTDISEIAPFQRMKLSFIGLHGEPSYIDVKPRMKFSKSKEIFSKTEVEILRFLVEGLNSEAIADKTFRSVHTIRTHRKNIFKKSGCNTVQELLLMSIRKGWI